MTLESDVDAQAHLAPQLKTRDDLCLNNNTNSRGLI